MFDFNNLAAAAATRQDEQVNDRLGDVLLTLSNRVDGLTGRDRIQFLTDLEAFLASGKGVELATQNNGTTPALALGGSGSTPQVDALRAQFEQVLTSDPGAVQGFLDMLGAVVELQKTDPARYQLAATALLRMVEAATKPEHALSAEERPWRLRSNRGEPQTMALADALAENNRLRAELAAANDLLSKMGGYTSALGAGAYMANEAYHGRPINPGGNADKLARALTDLKALIESAPAPTAP